jgi:hypothetical protein
MKYGKVLVSPLENQKKIFAFFTFQDILYLKNMIRAKNKIRLSRGVAAATTAAVDKNLSRRFFSRLKR